MKTIEIKGSFRTDLGKKATKQLRKEDRVPCVLYGGEEVVHFHANRMEFKELLYTPHAYLIDLKIDGKDYKAIVQDTQFHPVSDRVLHIDFLQISDDKSVSIGIPVVLEGFAEGVKKGGKLSLNMRRLRVRALAKDLPDELKINVTPIKLGKSLKVGELNFDNLELLDPASNVVCAVKLTRAARGAAGAADDDDEGDEESSEASAE